MAVMQTNVKRLVQDMDALSQAATKGELSTRADESVHQGEYRNVIAGMNETLDAVINPLNVAADYIDHLSRGEVPAKIDTEYLGDFNTIKQNLNACIDAINALIDDASMLADAAVAGELSARADENKHNGDYRKIIGGVNASLDAVVSPLQIAASYIDNLAKGAGFESNHWKV